MGLIMQSPDRSEWGVGEIMVPGVRGIRVIAQPLLSHDCAVRRGAFSGSRSGVSRALNGCESKEYAILEGTAAALD